ncbi:MAG: hypothetical protein ABIP38_04855 [Steroidobacteraceae bacterium]
MKKALWMALAVLLGVLTALRLAGDAGFWQRYMAASSGSTAEAAARLVEPRLALPGVATAVPRASAEAEFIAPEALQLAADAARKQGAKGLLVHRHGHRVLEYFSDGRSGAAEVAGGELSPALFALAAGALVDTRRIAPEAAVAAIRAAAHPGERWHNPWSAAAAHRFRLAAPPALLLQDMDGDLATTISRRVWLPLGTGNAWLWGTGDALLRLDCCAAARLEDWMRLGDLLLMQGNYHGERIVSPDWVRQLLAADPQGQRHPVWLGEQKPWMGDEPPAAREVFWFDLGNDLRLWLVPRRGLAVLNWTGAGNPRDTLIPNILLRGLLDQAPAQGAELDDMVPGH